MINTEKCGECEPIRALVSLGLSEQEINSIASAALYRTEANCYRGPAQMPGGWTRCDAAREVQGALYASETIVNIARSLGTVASTSY